jgi:pimeloyl-ACP methyl ester carboxylesterase
MIRRPIQSFRRYLLDRMVLQPTRHEIDFAPKRREVLNIEGEPLECFVQQNYLSDEPPELLALKFPGTAGRAERSTEFPMSQFPNLRCVTWTWNPPGYGGSAGRASLSRIANASIEFWRQVVQREAGPNTCVWLCGNSLGCVSAMNVAAALPKNSLRTGMLLRNPPPLTEVVKRIADRYPLGNLMGPVADSLMDSMNVLRTASEITLPAVFLQSELDELVPVGMQDEVIKEYAGPHRVVLMEGLSHGGLATDFHTEAIEASMEWLWEQTSCLSNEAACVRHQEH